VCPTRNDGGGISEAGSVRVAETPSESVVVYAEGMGEESPGPGGWGAVLSFGERTRELGGLDLRTTGERMRLRATVEALECLTRPVRVQVWVTSEQVREGTPGPWSDGDEDLLRRLAAVGERHEVEWVHDEFEWIDDDSPFERAADLAYEKLVEAESQAPTRAGATDESLGVALKRFLADQRPRLSRREFGDVDEVLSTLVWSIGWYAGEKADEIPAADVVDHLPDFYDTLVHKEFADPDRLRVVNSVLPNLLRWLQDQGHLDAETVESAVDEATDAMDDFVDVREFVNRLGRYAEATAPDLDLSALPADDRVTDEYLRIAQITPNSLTFEDWTDETTVGPVKLPAEICAMAQSDWQILLTAARVNGRWILLRVVNGDP
jgi:ribonuclease HI